jgi:phospholipid/cholesterol/gamma-HCH transport system substrate-binding protein
VTTRELNKIVPELNKEAPHLAKDMGSLMSNLSILTEEFKVVIPALAEVAPDLPRASRRALEALDEAVVLIKAMEKSFFVKSNAEEVREEEAKRDKKGKRVPSGD